MLRPPTAAGVPHLPPCPVLESLLLLLALLSAEVAHAADDPAAEPRVAKAPPARGRWVLDRQGKVVPGRPGERERGLQTSGLQWHAGHLWSVGDQRSEFAGHLFRIDPRTARLDLPPIAIVAETESRKRPNFAHFLEVPNLDFEGITAHPREARVLLAVTEHRRAGFLRIELQDEHLGETSGRTPPARLAEITAVRFPDAVRPFRDDDNSRLEGIVSSGDGEHLYVAYERRSDGLPRLYRTSWARATSGDSIELDELAIDFDKVLRRAEKGPARLNINGLTRLAREDGERILAIARDQERVLVIDPALERIDRVLDLTLLSPGGERIHWVSPEGIAADGEDGKLWIINDPDSVRGNFKLAGEEPAAGNFAALAPLLFELDLEAISRDPERG